MGYELKMRVGRLSQFAEEKHFLEDCVINLCKCHPSKISDVAEQGLKKAKPVLVWYEGDEKKTEDAYGSKPRPIPVQRVIDALRQDLKVLDFGNNDQPYRRFEWALSLLEAIEKRDNGKEKEFCVIFEGY